MWQESGSPGGSRTTSQHPNLEVLSYGEGRCLGSAEPTYLHGCEKNKLALSTGRPLTLEGRRSGQLSRPAATTHSCHTTPTALSCFRRVLVCFLRCTRHVYIIIQPTLSHHCAMKHLSRYFKHFTGIFCYSFIVFQQVEA